MQVCDSDPVLPRSLKDLRVVLSPVLFVHVRQADIEDPDAAGLTCHIQHFQKAAAVVQVFMCQDPVVNGPYAVIFEKRNDYVFTDLLAGRAAAVDHKRLPAASVPHLQTESVALPYIQHAERAGRTKADKEDHKNGKRDTTAPGDRGADLMVFK